MQIETIVKRNVLIVYLIGELDEYSAEEARRKLDKRFEDVNFECVIFDMSRLTFMDSTGIGLLIGRYKKLYKKNIRAYIQNPCLQVEKILRMSVLYELMPRLSNSEVI